METLVVISIAIVIYLVWAKAEDQRTKPKPPDYRGHESHEWYEWLEYKRKETQRAEAFKQDESAPPSQEALSSPKASTQKEERAKVKWPEGIDPHNPDHLKDAVE